MLGYEKTDLRLKLRSSWPLNRATKREEFMIFSIRLRLDPITESGEELTRCFALRGHPIVEDKVGEVRKAEKLRTLSSECDNTVKIGAIVGCA